MNCNNQALALRAASQAGREAPRGATLVEVVMSIVLTAIVLGSAIVPTMGMIATHQKMEAAGGARSGQLSAAARIESLAASAWRRTDPPAGRASWSALAATSMTVGDWSVRSNKSRLQLRSKARRTWATLLPDIVGFTIEVLREDGSWSKSPKKKDIQKAVAVRYTWTALPENAVYRVLAVPSDRAHCGAELELPKAEGPEKGYRRADYTSKLAFELGDWQ